MHIEVSVKGNTWGDSRTHRTRSIRLHDNMTEKGKGGWEWDNGPRLQKIRGIIPSKEFYLLKVGNLVQETPTILAPHIFIVRT